MTHPNATVYECSLSRRVTLRCVRKLETAANELTLLERVASTRRSIATLIETLEADEDGSTDNYMLLLLDLRKMAYGLDGPAQPEETHKP